MTIDDEEEPDKNLRLRIVRLLPRSPDNAIPCDGCEEEYDGAAVGLHVRYSYFELCADCLESLKEELLKLLP